MSHSLGGSPDTSAQDARRLAPGPSIDKITVGNRCISPLAVPRKWPVIDVSIVDSVATKV